MTHLDAERLPPLRPWIVGGKIAISCHKPRVFLIRAWAPSYSRPERLVDWICHHIGRFDFEGLEWWGYTYAGQPSYMRSDTYASGLTLQRFVAPRDRFVQRLLDEGRFGPAYGPPEDLEIPERGVVQHRALEPQP